ncbi:wd40 repeat-containing protein smu1-like [Nannochloropsis oceanica]
MSAPSPSSASGVYEVEASDVIKLILQFCKENHLLHTLQTLQTEAQVAMNTVDSMENFLADITQGRWDTVLPQVAGLQLPQEKLSAVYEQVCLELIEMRENDLAREMLRTTEPLQVLKIQEPDRYFRLETFLNRNIHDAHELYTYGINKERKRQEIADSLAAEVSVVPPSRLLSLLQQALKYQQLQGTLPKDRRYDLFRGGARTRSKDEMEKPPKKQMGQIKFGSKTHPECARFSPDGQHLVTGSLDGFVEVWDPDTCRLRKELPYQAREELMMHDTAVLSLTFSRDGEMLATGDTEGVVKIWKISSGKCLRKLDPAHAKGITSLAFSRDSLQLATASFDGTARLHGIKAGRVLKEFRGHTSFVNCVCFTQDGSRVLTGSSDGTVKVWDARTSDCLHTFRPAMEKVTEMEAMVHTVLPLPGPTDLFFVANRTATAYVTTAQGQVVKSMSSGKKVGGDITAAALSPKGTYAYCAGEDGVVYAFHLGRGDLESFVKVGEKEVIGVAHHPHRNVVVTFGDEGVLKVWKA